MHEHDEHGSRVFSGGPRQGPATELWHAQRELETVRAPATVASSENVPELRVALLARQVAEAQEVFAGRVCRIPTQALAERRRQIERLDRRARRLGAGSIRLHETGEIDDGPAFVVLRGRAPVLAGWTLAAIVATSTSHFGR